MGIAAQFTLTNVRSRWGLISWMARARTSFPVPVSPMMRTVESVGATNSACFKIRLRAGLWPMIASKSCSVRISSLR